LGKKLDRGVDVDVRGPFDEEFGLRAMLGVRALPAPVRQSPRRRRC